MYKALSPGAIGVRAANLEESLAAAKIGGFDGVEFSPSEIADLIAASGVEAVRGALYRGRASACRLGAAHRLARLGRELAGRSARSAPAGRGGSGHRRDARFHLDHAVFQ